MSFCNVLSTYCNPCNNSLNSWENFSHLSGYRKTAVVVATFLASVATFGVGSVASFRLFTEALSPTTQETASKAAQVCRNLFEKIFGGNDISTNSMDLGAKRALTKAFSQGIESGLEELERYMKGEDLQFASEKLIEGDKERAESNFRKAMEAVFRLTKQWNEEEEDVQKRYTRIFPEGKLSFEECLDKIFEARDLVIHPETAPIPNSHFVRVLAGAAIARIKLSHGFKNTFGEEFLQGVARYAALKKPEKVEERLNRWQTEIDPAQYPKNWLGMGERFKRNVGELSTFTPETLNGEFQPAILSQPITGKPKEGENFIGGYEFGVAHLCGRRSSQEDTHAKGIVKVNGVDLPFFAVCDGHGGEVASDFVALRLEKTMQEILEDKDLESLTDAQLENLLASLGVRLGEKFLEQYRDSSFERSGTTLTLALVLPRGNRKEIWTANVGDSRVVAVTPESTYQLTEDADPNAQRFADSCQRAGIPIFGGRLFASLAVARAIGDFGEGPSPKAKVTKMEVDPSKELEIILHCDGLNEVFCSNEVGEITRNSNFTTPQEKAEALVKAAFIGESADNLSALVVRIPAEKSEN